MSFILHEGKAGTERKRLERKASAEFSEDCGGRASARSYSE